VTGAAPPPGDAATREARRRGEPLTRITLLRHGEPDWTPRGASVPDPGLTPHGHAQARAAAARIAAAGVDAIYVSPYQRAQETAAPLARATGVAPVTLPGLAEIGVSVDGLSQDAVDRYFTEASQRPLADHWAGWPGAETFRDFHTRVTAALAELLARHGLRVLRDPAHDFTQWDLAGAPARIAVVAHGGTNAVALAHLLDVAPVPWEWLRFESELAAYSVVQARPLGPRGHVWSLQNFNEIDPLVEAGLRER
jgi:broad specificity phosphatase PhoE